MITLHPSTATAFDTQGLGALPDAISCEVTEERNGAFELTMEYPITGLHYKDIQNRGIVTAKPNPYEGPEPFRIYQISKPIGGRVKISAQHISYDLTGIPVSPYEAGNVAAALQGIKSNAAVGCPFEFWTDKTTQADFRTETPASARALLGGQAGSILDVFGGEYAWEGYTVRLYNRRGQDNGVSIRYGKNLTDLTQGENVAAVATGVYPYYKGSDGEIIEAPGKIVNAPGTYNFTRVIPLDVSQDFDAPPTPEEVKARAEKYVRDNNIGIPKVSISVAFQPLEQTEEYKNIAILERVRLCDTVNVEYPELGVDATAKCIKTTYDVIKGKYASVELGDAKPNITATISNQEAELKKIPTSSTIAAIADAITQDILGAKGGAVRMLDTNGDGEPDTLYIADNPDPALAKKVWRFNYQGWAASPNGYNGPFDMAASIDHGLYADFLTAGTLNADLVQITGMIINPEKPDVYWDLGSGALSANSIRQTINGERFVVQLGENTEMHGGYGLTLKNSGWVTTYLASRLAQNTDGVMRPDVTALVGYDQDSGLYIYEYSIDTHEEGYVEIQKKSESGDKRSSILIQPGNIVLRTGEGYMVDINSLSTKITNMENRISALEG